ncbi:MAG: hypothetical protein CUN55_13380, partial [Phototrophicales bacterium]
LIDVSKAKVIEETGSLGGSVSVTPALSSDTVAALEERQMIYSDSSKVTKGWVKHLSAGERAMGGATILGGIFSQTTYIPDSQPCSFVGESYLYALRYTTGTAWQLHVFDDPDPDANGDEVLEKVLIGKTASAGASLHVGDSPNRATLHATKNDSSNAAITQENLQGVESKEVGWREM